MITVLFENEALLKETSFSLDLLYQEEIQLLKRNSSIVNDVVKLNPDVLFIDISTNSLKIINTVITIKSLHTSTKIILLITSYSDHICWFAKEINISALLLKTSCINDVIKCIASTTNQSTKEFYCNYKPTIAYERISDQLSEIEKQILGFIGKGLRSQEISNLLNLSIKTIDNHRARIIIKLNCQHTSKLIYISTIYNLFSLKTTSFGGGNVLLAMPKKQYFSI